MDSREESKRKKSIGEISGSSGRSTSRTTNLNLLRLLLLLISMASTCSSIEQDIKTNTGKVSAPPPVVSSLLAVQNGKKTIGQTKKLRDYVCPKNALTGLALVFSVPCKSHSECLILGTEQRCCKRICRKGIPAPPTEPRHRAVFGVNRMCPKNPVPEILPVKICKSDIDCEDESRVCCPDKDFKLYCRTAAPVWSQLPFQRAHEPLMSLIGYMQCQMAPPPLLDLFPQPCNRTVECFPNLCCQEGPDKFCRPAKKSIIALVAQATQRFARG